MNEGNEGNEGTRLHPRLSRAYEVDERNLRGGRIYSQSYKVYHKKIKKKSKE